MRNCATYGICGGLCALNAAAGDLFVDDGYRVFIKRAINVYLSCN